VHDSASAHRAGLDGYKQIAIDETVVPDGSSGFSQGDDFSMGRGIVLTDVAIPTSAYDTPRANDDRSDRYFAGIERALSAAQGFVHPEFIRRRLVGDGRLFVGRHRTSF